MNNGYSNFNSDFLVIFLLLVLSSPQCTIAVGYVVGTTKSGVTQVSGFYLLLKQL